MNKVENMKQKYLIAYFSRKGNNYVNGKIENLSIGNTEVIAKMIQDIIGADLFHIKTAQSYPEDYDETIEVAKKELNNDARPELSNSLSNLDSYDVVFLEHPNWWGTIPMAVCTFLESNDFAGKTIIPFCTHEGSGLGNSVKDIKKLCQRSIVKNAVDFYGRNVNNSKDSVKKWIEKCM
jgi:flavodoxin